LQRAWVVRIAGLTVAFGFVALLAGLWLSPLGWRLNPLKPLRVLQWEVASKNPGLRTAAARELVDRILAGRVNHTQLASTLTAILAEQADRSSPWDPAKGDVVEAAQTHALLTPPEWEAYATHVLGWSYEARPRLRLGDDWPTHDKTLPHRRGTGRFVFEFESTGQLEVRIGAWTFQPEPHTIYALASSRGGGNGGLGPIPTAGMATTITPGQYTATLLLYCQTLVGRDVFHHLSTYEIPLTVLPPTMSSVTLISRPELVEAMRQAVRVKILLQSDGRSALFVDIGATPVDGVFSAFVWDGEREWAFNEVDASTRWGIGSARESWGEEKPKFRQGQQVELRLRPDPQKAMTKVDALEVWGEEIRVPCTVEGYGAAEGTRPATRPSSSAPAP